MKSGVEGAGRRNTVLKRSKGILWTSGGRAGWTIEVCRIAQRNLSLNAFARAGDDECCISNFLE